MGTAGFYHLVGQLDPDNADAWNHMIHVQNNFAQGEADYEVDARTYSESMRHTLHWAMVFTFEDPELLAEAKEYRGGLMGYFIRLHPTAFRANGVGELSWGDSFAVLGNTKGSMGWNLPSLIQGAYLDDYFEVARRAADHVREIRRAEGKPVTEDDYIYKPPSHSALQRRMARHGRARALRNHEARMRAMGR